MGKWCVLPLEPVFVPYFQTEPSITLAVLFHSITIISLYHIISPFLLVFYPPYKPPWDHQAIKQSKNWQLLHLFWSHAPLRNAAAWYMAPRHTKDGQGRAEGSCSMIFRRVSLGKLWQTGCPKLFVSPWKTINFLLSGLGESECRRNPID